MPVPKARGTSRVCYYGGQLLATTDLRDDVDYEARMRGLHVRALHGVWGIALGYEIFPTANKKVISVTQGMAYDCSGREIVMSTTLLVDNPQPPRGSTAPAWWFDLLIRYDDRESAEKGADRVRACPGSDSNLPTERIAWRWSYSGEALASDEKPVCFADDVRLGEEIPLVRVRVTKLGEIADLDYTVRRVAQGLSRPHIAGGTVGQGKVTIQGSPWHWTARIDTSSGGFNTWNPHYLVSLGDHPWLSPSSGFAFLTNQLSFEHKRSLLGPFITIQTPFRTGFTLDVRMATSNSDAFDSFPAATHQSVDLNLPVAVNWLGVEPMSGCQPPRESARIYWAGGLMSAIQFENLKLFSLLKHL